MFISSPAATAHSCESVRDSEVLAYANEGSSASDVLQDGRLLGSRKPAGEHGAAEHGNMSQG